MTESADADRDPPECICENATKKLYNPDCYWHGTEGVEILETEPAKFPKESPKGRA